MAYAAVSFYDSNFVKHPFDIEADLVDDKLFVESWAHGDYFADVGATHVSTESNIVGRPSLAFKPPPTFPWA